MIILTKKKFIYVIGFIILFIFLYMTIGYSINSSNQNRDKTIQTTALPVNNKVIILDAGHGIPDERGTKQ